MIAHASSGDRGVATRHRPGMGLHPLPMFMLSSHGLRQLDSRLTILLAFVIWAERRGWDPASLYDDPALAGMDRRPPLRVDALLAVRGCLDMPAGASDEPILADLAAIGESALVDRLRMLIAGQATAEPAYTHWVVTDDGQIAGEARELDPPDRPDEQGQHFCYVRLFAMPELAEYGYSNASQLRLKRW